MRERRRIIDLYRRGDAVALATIIRVEGSSYRRAGARLLIAANGEYAGAISGGCLESEVIRRARWAVRSGAVVERYSTIFDDASEMPYGLGCGGTLYVLLEPAATPEFETLMHAMQTSLSGKTVHLRTALPTATSRLERVVISPNEHMGRKEVADVFEETLSPPQRLVIFGAGDDAQPVSAFAAQLGWTVWVVDGRSQWARPERFPDAERVIVSQSLDRVEIEASDAIVVMTHSYGQDFEWLKATLPKQPRYAGLLGARHRSALLLSQVADALHWPLKQVCERVFAPIGIDLGGDGAEAIALAVVAEVQAHIAGKSPMSRHMTPELIEQQKQEGDAARYLQSECAL